MTEAQWLTEIKYRTMLECLTGRVSNRRQQLLACAIVRCALTPPRLNPLDARHKFILSFVPVVEQTADGDAALDEVRKTLIAWTPLQKQLGRRSQFEYDEDFADVEEALMTILVRAEFARRNGPMSGDFCKYLYNLDPYLRAVFGTDGWEAVQATFCQSIKEVVGNPFRPVMLSPALRTDSVLTVATQMYESRDFSAMPILADALQDAGCENADVLGHCRGPGPHVRGCWVVDLILGKA